MRIRVDSRIDGIVKAAGDTQRRKVLKDVSMRAKLVMERYVPMRDGFLRDSADLSSRFEAGEIVYATPYAHYQYELVTANRTTPGTNGHWDEAAMASHGKDLEEYAKASIVRVMNS